MLKHVQGILNEIFRSQMLFSVDDGLSLITCCKGKGEYTIGIANNTGQEKPINIRSHCGSIKSIEELPLDQSEKTAVGYLPEVVNKEQIGHSEKNKIAGGDIRILSLQVKEQNVEQIPHSVLPSRPQNRYLPLRNIRQIKEEILKRPTFFEHFDGVVVDWKYLEQREKNVLLKEAGWVGRQKLKIVIDCTSGVDFFPELRLIDNVHADYETSLNRIEDVIDKMGIFHAMELILPLHRFPENNFTKQQTWESFKTTFSRLGKYAQPEGINLNLRLALGRPPYTLKEADDFIEKTGVSNLRLAPETAFMLDKSGNANESITQLKAHVGLWLVSGLKKDLEGKYWNQNVPVFACNDKENVMRIIGKIPQAPIVLDGIYKNQDEEYLDARVLDKPQKS